MLEFLKKKFVLIRISSIGSCDSLNFVWVHEYMCVCCCDSKI